MLPQQQQQQQRALPEPELAQMVFLLQHLDTKGTVKKRNNAYILKHANGAKMTYAPAYLETCMSMTPCEIKQVQVLTFLHNALNDGWNIKKHGATANKYVFIKKHHGRREMYADDEYLTRFIKTSLNLEGH